MQASVLDRYGDPGEVLEARTVDDPAPGPGEVLVELRAAALNNHDRATCAGKFGTPTPHIIGSDGSGVRRDTGDEVIVNPAVGWGDREAAPAADWHILGDVIPGTFAELIAVPEELLAPKPRGMNWQQAAALPLGGLTAFRALFGRGALRPGETVVVLGAGSGVSTITIAFARMAGAHVLVTSSSQAKIDRAVELGAAGGVDYTAEGWVEELRAMTPGGEGADLVIDSVGSTIPASLAALRKGGRVVSFGMTGGATTELDVRGLFFGQCSILGTMMGSPRDFAGMLALLEANPGWTPEIASVHPLAEAGAALVELGKHQHQGKLVLEI